MEKVDWNDHAATIFEELCERQYFRGYDKAAAQRIFFMGCLDGVRGVGKSLKKSNECTQSCYTLGRFVGMDFKARMPQNGYKINRSLIRAVVAKTNTLVKQSEFLQGYNITGVARFILIGACAHLLSIPFRHKEQTMNFLYEVGAKLTEDLEVESVRSSLERLFESESEDS